MHSNKKIKSNFEKYSCLILGAIICLWSTTWSFGVIQYSHILYVFLALLIISSYFINNLAKLNFKYFIFFNLILTFYFIYFLVGIFKYSKVGYDVIYVLEYFFKQSFLIFSCFFLINFFHKNKNIDYFFQSSVIIYIFIFTVLIFIYQFIFNSPYIGVRIDFEFGRNRYGKNTLALALPLILPFLITFIVRNKKYFTGFIFLSLYTYIIISIESRAALLISFFQLILFIFLFKSKLVKINLLILCFIMSFSFGLKFGSKIIEGKFISGGEIVKKERPYFFHDSHRGWLIYSAVEEIKNNNFLGSGTGGFRIRDNNEGSLTETHNAFLSIFVNYGLAGFILYFAPIFYFIFSILFSNKNLSFTDYKSSCFLYSLTIFPVFLFINFEFAPIVWILNSICLSQIHR